MSTVENAPTEPFVGRSIRRKEDPPLLTGEATYIEDLTPAGTCHAVVVRSPEAHARIVAVDASAALAREDVLAVLTGEDLEDLKAPLPMGWKPPGTELRSPEHWPLARGKVCHVGDPVAVIVGTDRYALVDAAEQVVVEYDPLPPVVDPEAALAEGADLVHDEFGTNISYEWSLGGGDLDTAWREADVVLERRIVNHRVAGAAIEPRGTLAEWRSGRLTVWSATQIPHILKLYLAIMLGIPEPRVRVIAPEVGGGFGSKLNVYAEEVLVAYLARRLRRPVKWIETRSENLSSSVHCRDQVDYVKMGAKRDGTITGLHARIVADLGAYHQLLTPVIPTLTAFVMSGCYRIPAVQTDITAVFTNKFPTDSIRGAGRPEATHIVEMMVEQVAAELGLDPLDVRRRNFIPKEDFPAQVAIGVVYDSGDYHASLDKLLEQVDVDAFRREQAELRERGVYKGIGFSTYVENSGFAPTRIVGPSAYGLQAGYGEAALVRVHISGAATVYTGTSPHGQGVATSFAQIVADRIGIPPDAVEVIHGDTETGPWGMGTYGSRSLSVGGEAVALTAEKVAAKARLIAAHKLEASPEDIELHDGSFSVRGAPGTGMTLAEISAAAYISEDLPEGMEPGLEETTFFDPENFVWPFGAHAAICEVDVETGKVKLVRYVAVDDCGPAINPMIIDGQIHGGVAHAVGQALFEQIVYDEQGQLVTGTFVDYALPTAAELPMIESHRTETPSPVNSLGVKGVGEAGTIGASPAVTNAVIDALRPLGVTFINMPLSPMRVWQAIEGARDLRSSDRQAR